MTLDPKTLQAMIYITSLAMVVALATVATGRRVTGLWALAGSVLANALTFILQYAYGHLPQTFALCASNCTIALTLSLLLMAILQLRGLRLHRLWMVAPPFIAVALSVLLLHAQIPRNVATDALSAAQGTVALWMLIRDGGIGIGRGRHILAASLVMSVLLFTVRCLAVATGLLSPPLLPAIAAVDTLNYLIAYLIMVFATLGFVLAAAEITADRHHQLAMQDALTGLPNRRAVLDHLTRHWSAALRAQRPVTVLLIDIDHFKKINDQHGHPVGDSVLRRIAKLLRARVRSHDMVGRFGGEEFLAVLPDTAPDSARVLAESLRTKIASVPVQIRGKILPVTVSIGLHGLWPTSANTVGDLIQQADAALYRAKAAGRNCVSGDWSQGLQAEGMP